MSQSSHSKTGNVREWYPSNPRNKTYHGEDGEQKEHNSAGPIFPRKHVYRCDESEYDVKDAGHPDELLREDPRKPNV